MRGTAEFERNLFAHLDETRHGYASSNDVISHASSATGTTMTDSLAQTNNMIAGDVIQAWRQDKELKSIFQVEQDLVDFTKKFRDVLDDAMEKYFIEGVCDAVMAPVKKVAPYVAKRMNVSEPAFYTLAELVGYYTRQHTDGDEDGDEDGEYVEINLMVPNILDAADILINRHWIPPPPTDCNDSILALSHVPRPLWAATINSV